MERIESFHDLLLWIIILISVFVLALLGLCLRPLPRVAQRQRRRGAPTTRVLEIAWTAVPVLILVVIAIPSFKLLYYQDVVPDAELTVKAVGHQWYWSYEYPDNGDFTFDAYMVADAGSAARAAAPADHRQPRGAAGRDRHPPAGHRDRRAALLGGAGVRREDGRGAGADQRDLAADRRSRASTTDSAPSCAATITASCRS